MDIACPQCSMKYALDPRLLPPGGVPVQCTRCSHIFIAAPPSPADGTGGGAKSAPNLGSTVLYGANANTNATTRPAPSPSGMGTQVFGAVPAIPAMAPLAPVAPKPAPAPAATSPSLQRTQVFGAVPPVPTVAPAAPKPVPAPVPAPKAPTGLNPALQRTQVFGAVPQPGMAPPPAPPPITAPPPAPPRTPTVTAPISAPPRPLHPPTPIHTPLAPPVPDLPGSFPGVARTFIPKPAAPTQQNPPVPRRPSLGSTPAAGSAPPPAPAPQRPSGVAAPAVGSAPQPPAPALQRPSGVAAPAVGSAPQQPAPQRPSGVAAPAVGNAPPQPAAAARPPVSPAPPAPAPTPAVPPPSKPLWSPPANPDASAPRPAPPAQRRPLGPASASEPFTAVAATTPIELPDEILVQLNRPISELMAEEPLDEPSSMSSGNAPGLVPPAPVGTSAPAVNKPLELPPELMDTARDAELKKAGMGKGSHASRWIILSVGVLVLALAGVLASTFWRKPTALPPDVQAAKEAAVAQLRRDDTTSKEEALGRLRALSAARPQNVELLAELGIALAVHLDDTQVRVTTLAARVKQLQTQISRLSAAQTPADWQSRVNALEEERAATQKELTPREELVHTLFKEAVQVLKRLESVPEKESREDMLTRLRARAMLNATLGGNETPDLARKLAQADLRDWNSMAMAEYVLNQQNPSPMQIKESAAALEHLRETNTTYLRAYVLGARIALMRRELVSAQSLLDTVITLNPRHELARQLSVYTHALATQEREPAPTPRPPPPTPTPTPTPAPTTPQETAPSPTPENTPGATPGSTPGATPGSTPTGGNAPSP